MEKHTDSNWFNDVVQQHVGYDELTVNRFGDRLIRLAKSRLPDRLQRRIDPEDIVQSVFRSFFARHEAGQFEFSEAPDVWRLLAAITYAKIQKTIRFHARQQRDIGRESYSDDCVRPTYDVSPNASAVIMMMELLDQILEELPETHREIVRLRMESFTISEIAERMKISTRTVLRALKLVREVAIEHCTQTEK